jgi:hypothetical protein
MAFGRVCQFLFRCFSKRQNGVEKKRRHIAEAFQQTQESQRHHKIGKPVSHWPFALRGSGIGITVTYSVRPREQAFDSGLGQIPHPISESLY